MGFLGYQKGEIREYNDKRCCGLWFIIIGVVIIVSAIFGGEQKIHPIIFTVGFIVGFYLSVINKKVVTNYPMGNRRNFKIIWLFFHSYFVSTHVCFSRFIFSNAELENDLANDFSRCWNSFYTILFCSWYFNDRNCDFMFC